ncbi:hypothetical protein D3C76_1193560 [compost metagenome]
MTGNNAEKFKDAPWRCYGIDGEKHDVRKALGASMVGDWFVVVLGRYCFGAEQQGLSTRFGCICVASYTVDVVVSACACA